MDPCRSSSAPLHVAAGQSRRSQQARRSPHHLPGLPSSGERSIVRLGRYSVIPPLREQWGPILHREEGSSNGDHVHAVPGRPTGLQRHVVFQESQPASPEHHYRHPNHPLVTYSQPISNPFFSQPLPSSFHAGAFLPAYPQMPLAYPVTSYPPMPLLPLMNSPLQFVPQLPLQYPLPANHLPVRLPEITELSEATRPLPRTYPEHQLRDAVCKKVCSQLLESSLQELVREIVNSCVNDIVRSYWDRSHLVLSTPYTERVQPVVEDHPHMTDLAQWPGGGRYRGVTEEGEHGVPVKPLRGEARLLHLQTNSELSHYTGMRVLDELLFCQLLEALVDGGKELAVHTQAKHVLNGLMFKALLQCCVRKTS